MGFAPPAKFYADTHEEYLVLLLSICIQNHSMKKSVNMVPSDTDILPFSIQHAFLLLALSNNIFPLNT